MSQDEDIEWPSFDSVLREIAPDTLSLRGRKAAEPEDEFLDEPERKFQPEPELVPETEPEFVLEPELVPEPEPEQEPELVPEPQPEFVLEPEPEPELIPEPELEPELDVHEIDVGVDTSPEQLPPPISADQPDVISEEILVAPAETELFEELTLGPLSDPVPPPLEYLEPEPLETVEPHHETEGELLNPFDPEFEGIADEIVEGDGWVTHSGHDITAADQALPDVDASPVGEQRMDFDRLNFPAFDTPPDLGQADPVAVDEPVELPTSSWPTGAEAEESSFVSMDLSGLLDADETPIEPVEFSEPELIEFDDEMNWPEPVEPATPADLLIDFEDLTPKEDATEPPIDEPDFNGSSVWDLDVNPLDRATDEIPPPPPPPPPPAESTPDAEEETEPVEAVEPIESAGAVEAELTEPVQTAESESVDDPWGQLRPNDPPEKITFWENRPKFFGGDDRRKARARRQARERSEQETLSAELECPNCGELSKVDVRDPSSGRLHMSCDACRHMWSEAGPT